MHAARMMKWLTPGICQICIEEHLNVEYLAYFSYIKEIESFFFKKRTKHTEA